VDGSRAIVSNPRQLVVLGSDVTALAVVRGASRLGLSPVVVDTQRGIATTSRLARMEVHTDAQPTELVPLIRDLAAGSSSALLATSDVWLRTLVEQRAELASTGAQILHPRNASLEICLDKRRFAAWCKANGLPTPRVYEVPADAGAEACRDIAFPVLVRPSSTLHDKILRGAPKAVEVRCPEELNRCLDGFRHAGVVPVVAESLLGRKLQQFSVGLARTGGGKMATVVTRKLRPPPELCGVGSLVETSDQPEVECLAERVATALDYVGIAEVEVLRDEASGELFLIEVNARPWLQFAVAAATHRDLLAFLLRGPVPSSNALERRKTPRSAVWIDFSNDLRVCFGAKGLIPTGRLTVSSYVRSVARANVFARWSVRDPRPFWRDTCALVRALLERARRSSPVA
jgi:predicted ATP-grasp superfamily ATP-dependent carboligase